MCCVSKKKNFFLKSLAKDRGLLCCNCVVLQKHLELIRVQTGIMRNKRDGTHSLTCCFVRDELQPPLNGSLRTYRVRLHVCGHGTEDKANCMKGVNCGWTLDEPKRASLEGGLANTARRTPSLNNRERKRWREWGSVTPLICHQLEEMASSASSSPPADAYSEWVTARRRHFRADHQSALNQT